LRHVGLMIAAGMLLCLPAAAAPATRVYSIHAPGASRVEARVSSAADWDVSVSFDPATCEVVCEYRRKERGVHLFLPPVTELRVYRDGPTTPEVMFVDPAGLRNPIVVHTDRSVPNLSWIAGKGLSLAIRLAVSGPPSAPAVSGSASSPSPVHRTTLSPLRI
jgi:hypothetical protein